MDLNDKIEDTHIFYYYFSNIDNRNNVALIKKMLILGKTHQFSKTQNIPELSQDPAI